MVGWVGGSAGSGLGPFQPVLGGLGGHLSPNHARESNLSKVRFPCLMFSEQADANHASQCGGKKLVEKSVTCVWAECRIWMKTGFWPCCKLNLAPPGMTFYSMPIYLLIKHFKSSNKSRIFLGRLALRILFPKTWCRLSFCNKDFRFHWDFQGRS